MNEKNKPEVHISLIEFDALCRKIDKLEESIERIDNHVYFMNIKLNKAEMKKVNFKSRFTHMFDKFTV